jgi:hypothetical protein
MMLVAPPRGVLGLPARRLQAAGTPAGTDIVNIAPPPTTSPAERRATVDSNIVTIKVDELLDVTVAWRDPADVATSPGLAGQILSFTVTNAGNGHEASPWAPSPRRRRRFRSDRDLARPRYQRQRQLRSRRRHRLCARRQRSGARPDGSIVVFVLSTIPPAPLDGNRGRIDLTATSPRPAPARPAPASRARARAAATPSSARPAPRASTTAGTGAQGEPRLRQEATVADAVRRHDPGPGLDHHLHADRDGQRHRQPRQRLKVTDPIPTGTTYKAGSITLDGARSPTRPTPTRGASPAPASPSASAPIAAGTSKTVTFQVKID